MDLVSVKSTLRVTAFAKDAAAVASIIKRAFALHVATQTANSGSTTGPLRPSEDADKALEE